MNPAEEEMKMEEERIRQQEYNDRLDREAETAE